MSSDIPRTDPSRRANIGDQLRRHAGQQPDREALVGLLPGGRRVAWTYADLDRDADRLANVFAARGLQRGDAVAVCGRSTPQTLVAFYAAMRLGLAATGLNPQFNARELRYQLAHAGVRAVLAEPEPAAVIDTLRDDLPELRTLLINDAVSDDAPAGWDLLSTVLAGAPTTTPDAEVDEDDVALLTYTSGTEADPKGVRLSHRGYLISTLPSFVAGLGLRADDVWYYLLPFHTTAGLGSQIVILALGGTLVLPYDEPVAAVPALLERERVTVVSQTPTFYLGLTRTADFATRDLSALRLCVTYGGTMPTAMFELVRAAAPAATWATFWSQSELSQTPIAGRFRDLGDIPGGDASWIGRPTPQLEIRIVDENGEPSDEGELLCRSPGIMLGYHENPDKTAKVLEGGWLHTGDLVRRDADGELFFVDRLGDVIKTGGMNVSSVEVERVLYAHADVLEVAVVGIADDYWSQAVTAFVVPRGESHASDEELRSFCKEQLSGFKVPKTVVFRDSLPKDAQGKTRKRELRGR